MFNLELKKNTSFAFVKSESSRKNFFVWLSMSTSIYWLIELFVGTIFLHVVSGNPVFSLSSVERNCISLNATFDVSPPGGTFYFDLRINGKTVCETQYIDQRIQGTKLTNEQFFWK